MTHASCLRAAAALLGAALVALDPAGAHADAMAEALAREGWAELAQQKWGRAQFAFERALAHDEKAPATWHGLGNALFWQERYPGALHAFERANALEPDHPRALGGVGHACLNLATRTWQTPASRRALLVRAGEAFAAAIAAEPTDRSVRDGASSVQRALARSATPPIALQGLAFAALVSLMLLFMRRRRRDGPTLDWASARAAVYPVLPAFLLTRGLVLLGFWLSPLLVAEAPEHPVPVLAGKDSPVLSAVAARWDSNWYARVALEGYRAEPDAPGQWSGVGQLPLLPILYRWSMYLVGDAQLAALLLPHLTLLLSAVLLFALVRESHGRELARRVVWTMLLLPGSLYGSVLYAEPVAMLCLLAAYACSRRGYFELALLAGLLAGLTRINTLALVPLLALDVWQRRRAVSSLAILAALGPLLGLLAFMLYTQVAFGDALAYMHELRIHRFGGQGVAVAAHEASRLMELFFGRGSGVRHATFAPVLALGLLCTLAYSAAAIQLWRQQQHEEAAFVLAGLLLALGSNLAAQPRYLWLLFPACIRFVSWASAPWLRAAGGAVLGTILFAEAVGYAAWYYIT